jgi:hypothetical protein
MLLVDDYTKMNAIFFLKNKSEAFENFKIYKEMVENEMDSKIKYLKSDNGGEFTSKEFMDYCSSHGIKRQFFVASVNSQSKTVFSVELCRGYPKLLVACSTSFLFFYISIKFLILGLFKGCKKVTFGGLGEPPTCSLTTENVRFRQQMADLNYKATAERVWTSKKKARVFARVMCQTPQ